MIDEPYAVSTEAWGQVDICYSPDDGGWYGQRWSDDATTTKIHATPQECASSLHDSCEWNLP